MFQPFHVAMVLFSGVISRFLPPSLHIYAKSCSDGILLYMKKENCDDDLPLRAALNLMRNLPQFSLIRI